MPPNSVEATILTWPRPPRRWPTMPAAKRISRSAMPPRTIRSPAKMKNGMAIIAKTFMPEFICWKTTIGGSPM
ncbi:hypothetical protein D3C80_1909370 [compost metagenome]